MQQTRILIAHPHPVVRKSLRQFLERVKTFEVTGEAADSRETLLLADFARPDAAILDIKLPTLNGIAIAKELHSRHSGLGLVFLSGSVDEEYISEALKAGARGYVSESTLESDLVPAIQAIAAGHSYISANICSQLWDSNFRKNFHPTDDEITQRHKSLFFLVVSGHNEEEIADALCIERKDVCREWDEVVRQFRGFGASKQLAEFLHFG